MWRLNQSLLRFALKNRIRSSVAARGVCLDATIQLARYCRRLGMDASATAVHWRVPGDRHFREHWALGVGNGLVLDMTAVQVDGNTHPLRQVRHYPAHFGQPSVYPLDLILRAPQAAPGQAASRLPMQFLMKLQFAMAAYDLRHGKLRQGLARYLQAPILVALGTLQHWAHARLVALTLSTPAVKGQATHRPIAQRPLPNAATQHPQQAVLVTQLSQWLAKSACAIGCLGIPACDHPSLYRSAEAQILSTNLAQATQPHPIEFQHALPSAAQSPVGPR